MSDPVSHYTQGPEIRARRVTEAYRTAERLGRPARGRSEWTRLCKADQARRDFYKFADFLDRRQVIEDAEFEEIHPEREHDHRIRSAYLLGAITAGSFCLLLGGLFF